VILYARKSAIGVGLIQFKTAVAVSAMKLFVGNKRAEIKINNIINVYSFLPPLILQ